MEALRHALLLIRMPVTAREVLGIAASKELVADVGCLKSIQSLQPSKSSTEVTKLQ